MILFDRVTHYQSLRRPPVLLDVSIAIPTDQRIAVLGIAGSGKSTTARIITGHIAPKRGALTRRCRVSYPVGPAVNIAGKNSVRQNLIDIARLYGARPDDLIDFIVHWGDAASLLNRPVSNLSPKEKPRIFYPLVYGLPFDFYIFDGDPAGSNPAFRDKFLGLAKQRTAETGMLFFTNKPKQAIQYCSAGAILHEGKLVLFRKVQEAVAIFERDLRPIEEANEAAENAAREAAGEGKRAAKTAQDAPEEGVYL